MEFTSKMEPAVAMWHFNGNWAIWLIVALLCSWACVARTVIWQRNRKDPKNAKSHASKALKYATLACWCIWAIFPCVIIVYVSGLAYISDLGCQLTWALLVFVWMIGNDSLYFFLRGKCFVTNAMNKDKSFLNKMKFLKYYLRFYQILAIGAAASAALRASIDPQGECVVELSAVTVPALILTDLVVKVMLLIAFLNPVRDQWKKRRMSKKNKVAPANGEGGGAKAKNPMAQHMKTIKRNVYTTGVSILSTEGLLFGLLTYNIVLERGPLGYLLWGGVIAGALNMICLCLCFKGTDLDPRVAFGYKKIVPKKAQSQDRKKMSVFGSTKAS